MSEATNQPATEGANSTQAPGSSQPPAGGATAAPDASKSQPATDAQAPAQGDAKPQGDKPAEAKADAPASAPEKYEDFKLPEGASLDDIGRENFEAFAKSQNLSQDAAQKMLDSMLPAMRDTQMKRIEAVQNAWLEQSKGDKEIGGDKFTESTALADKALKSFGTEALDQLLKETGLARHPEIIRAFAKVGKTVAEDSNFVAGGNNRPVTSLAQQMYPDMNP